MTDLKTLEPGTKVTVELTIITCDATASSHWGPNLKIVGKLDGIDGVAFADLRATVDRNGPWFTKMAARALDRLENPQPDVVDHDTGETEDEVKEEAKPAPKKRAPRKTAAKTAA